MYYKNISMYNQFCYAEPNSAQLHQAQITLDPLSSYEFFRNLLTSISQELRSPITLLDH
jgi:hypothetical protein